MNISRKNHNLCELIFSSPTEFEYFCALCLFFSSWDIDFFLYCDIVKCTPFSPSPLRKSTITKSYSVMYALLSFFLSLSLSTSAPVVYHMYQHSITVLITQSFPHVQLRNQIFSCTWSYVLFPRGCLAILVISLFRFSSTPNHQYFCCTGNSDSYNHLVWHFSSIHKPVPLHEYYYCRLSQSPHYPLQLNWFCFIRLIQVFALSSLLASFCQLNHDRFLPRFANRTRSPLDPVLSQFASAIWIASL